LDRHAAEISNNPKPESRGEPGGAPVYQFGAMFAMANWAADGLVKAAGFVLGTVSCTGVCSSAGHVLTQAPAAGVLARLGSAISVTVGRLKLCA
jgi:hypothetical protein